MHGKTHYFSSTINSMQHYLSVLSSAQELESSFVLSESNLRAIIEKGIFFSRGLAFLFEKIECYHII